MSLSMKDFSQSKFDRKQHKNELIKKYEIKRKLKDMETSPPRPVLDDEPIPPRIQLVNNAMCHIDKDESNKTIDLDPKEFDTPRFDNMYRYPGMCGCCWKKSKWYSRHHKTLNKKGSNKDNKKWRNNGNNSNPSNYYLRNHISQELESY